MRGAHGVRAHRQRAAWASRAYGSEPAAWASAGGAGLVVVAAVVGACHKDPVITTRAVTLHAPQGCAPELSNLDGGAFAVYHALGDYEPAAPTDGHLLKVGTALPEIDPAARALLVVATGDQDRQWQGASALAPAGPVDVLLLPATTPCVLRGTLGSAANWTMGLVGSQRVLVLGSGGGSGADASASPAPAAVALGLDTGEVDTLKANPEVTAATVTQFGAGALVAGGRSNGVVLDKAEVYDPVLGDFAGQAISLTAPRAEAGAAILSTGETLLVGGVGADGTIALDSMEIVDPVTRKARMVGAKLVTPRRAPTVLRLASGEIFVAGGVDSTGTPVVMGSLEWFSPDASDRAKKNPQDLVAGSARAYAALEGGGVLAVIAPPANAPSTFLNTWVIGADGEPVAAVPVEGALVTPVLFGGAGGAPLLWTGTSAGASPGASAPGRWLRWQPWTGTFAPVDVLDDTPGRIVGAAASPDPGTALWLDTATPGAPRLAALRFDVRGEYSTLSDPLLLTDTTDTAPDQLATDGMLSFDPSAGLTLQSGASAFVTDRTYADVRIEVDAPTGQPALLVLRDALGNEIDVGGSACPGAVVTGAASSLTVERKGATLTWTVSGRASGTCALGFAATARVSVGVRAAPDLIRSVVRNLRVTRLHTD